MPNKKKSIGFIGGGRITKIFLKAFKNSNETFEKIIVFDPNSDALSKLKKMFPSIIVESIAVETLTTCDIIFLAVHPPVVMECLSKIKPLLKTSTMIVSLAPKISIEKMTSALNGFKSIARANPSALGIINQGINPIAFSSTTSNSEKKYLISLMQILGKTPEVLESKIEAYAMINAMGPTYFWFQFQQLKMLGISYGMDENEAKEVISAMIKGSVDALFNSNMRPEDVMDLIPVKPINDHEETIKEFYTEKLNAIYNKIKPQQDC